MDAFPWIRMPRLSMCTTNVPDNVIASGGRAARTDRPFSTNVHLTECVASVNLQKIDERISALLLPGLLSFLAWVCRTVAGLCIGSLTVIALPSRSLAFLTLMFSLPFMHLLLLFVLGTFDIGTDGGCITSSLPLFVLPSLFALCFCFELCFHSTLKRVIRFLGIKIVSLLTPGPLMIGLIL